MSNFLYLSRCIKSTTWQKWEEESIVPGDSRVNRSSQKRKSSYGTKTAANIVKLPHGEGEAKPKILWQSWIKADRNHAQGLETFNDYQGPKREIRTWSKDPVLRAMG